MIPSLMLLELLAAEYQCPVTDLAINFRNMLVHPELALAGKLSTLDPNGVKSAIGGIHPMAHRGSFMETKEDIPPEGELSWARVKASWIMMLWLQHRYPERVQVLSASQLSELSNYQKPKRALPIASLLGFDFCGFEEYFKTFGKLDSYLNRTEASDVFPELESHASDVFLSMDEFVDPQELWETKEATSNANNTRSRRPSR